MILKTDVGETLNKPSPNIAALRLFNDQGFFDSLLQPQPQPQLLPPPPSPSYIPVCDTGHNRKNGESIPPSVSP